MSEQVLYKAMAACRVGGAFRREGDVFFLPEFQKTPPFLIKATAEADEAPEAPKKASSGRKTKKSEADEAPAPGVMPEDIPGAVRD